MAYIHFDFAINFMAFLSVSRQSYLTGCFWLIARKVCEVAETYGWYLVIVWMQIQWWKYHEVLGTLKPYLSPLIDGWDAWALAPSAITGTWATWWNFQYLIFTAPDSRPGDLSPSHATDIWWSSLETCPNFFTWWLPSPVLTSSGGYLNTYGCQAVGTHPNGMHSCFRMYFPRERARTVPVQQVEVCRDWWVRIHWKRSHSLWWDFRFSFENTEIYM